MVLASRFTPSNKNYRNIVPVLRREAIEKQKHFKKISVDQNETKNSKGTFKKSPAATLMNHHIQIIPDTLSPELSVLQHTNEELFPRHTKNQSAMATMDFKNND